MLPKGKKGLKVRMRLQWMDVSHPMDTVRIAKIDQCIAVIRQYTDLNRPEVADGDSYKALLEWWNGLSADIQQTFLGDATVFRAALGYENRYKDFITL